ncbi:MAG: insulinase family protein, partial [Gemmatimonadaceae bacterium]
MRTRGYLLLTAAATLAPLVLAQAQAAFDMSAPPALARPARLRVPIVSSGVLPSNKLTIRVVEQHELPLVQVTAVVAGGSRSDGDRPGMASFVANMLDEGAGTRDATTLQAEFAFLGARLSTSSDWDRLTISLKVPLRSLGPALDLMADVILRPTFSAVEIRRQRDLRLTSLLQTRDQPEEVASLAFFSALFPVEHPYHNSADGDSIATARLDSSAVRDFYLRTVRPERTTFIVVGDLGTARARAEI